MKFITTTQNLTKDEIDKMML